MDDWFEMVASDSVPKMIQNLQVTLPSEYQLNVCCFFRRLSGYPEFSGVIQEDVVPVMDVCVMNSKSPKMKVSCDKLCHNDESPQNIYISTFLHFHTNSWTPILAWV